MIKRFSISLLISSLTSKCDIPVSFIYWSNNKFIVDTIQHFKWFLLLNYIFKSFGRCIVGQYFYLFHRPSVRIDLSMPLFHLSIESLRLLVMLDSAFSDEILLLSLYLGPLVKNFLNLLFCIIRKSLLYSKMESF